MTSVGCEQTMLFTPQLMMPDWLISTYVFSLFCLVPATWFVKDRKKSVFSFLCHLYHIICIYQLCMIWCIPYAICCLLSQISVGMAFSLPSQGHPQVTPSHASSNTNIATILLHNIDINLTIFDSCGIIFWPTVDQYFLSVWEAHGLLSGM